MKKTLLMLATLAVVSSIGVPGFAQGPPPPTGPGAAEPRGAGPVIIQAPIPSPALGSGRAFHNYFFMGLKRDWGKTVTGAPYLAQTVTETTQTLSDGNRIDQKETGMVYRDSAGRTRREHTLSMIGPWATFGKPVEIVTIHDPVAGVDYVLNAGTKTAYKLPPLGRIRPRDRSERRMRRREELPMPTTTESLGTKMIEGVKVEGMRKTAVIPAGKIGNEKPIKIVSESWYSPELQVYLLTTRNDPRFGETSYRLTDIKLCAPPASLFQVPSGYAIRNAPPRRFEQRPAPRRQGSGNPH